MQNTNRIQQSTTDGFIRIPIRVSCNPLRAKNVRKQPRHLIADTVTANGISKEKQARLVFYRKLAQQSSTPQPKSYSLAEKPVSKNLSIELFAEEIESRLQNALYNSNSEDRAKRIITAASKRSRRMLSQLSRAKNLF